MRMDNRLYQRLTNFLSGSCSMKNVEASNIIRRFVKGESQHRWEWDDFSSVRHTNPDVELALTLCWYYEGLYPSENPHEYCADEGALYFLKIADALEAGRFTKLKHKESIKSIKNKIIPDEIKETLRKPRTGQT